MAKPAENNGSYGGPFYRNNRGSAVSRSDTVREPYRICLSVWYGSIEKFAERVRISHWALKRQLLGDLGLPADMVRWLIDHAEESKALRMARWQARCDHEEARLRQADECVALLKAALEEYERSVESNWTNTGYQPPEKAKMLRQGRREAAAKQPRMLRQDGRNSGRFA